MNNLIEIMRKYSDKVSVTIPKRENCESFWSNLTNDLYHNRKLENMGLDCDVRDYLQRFAESDSLDLINKHGRILKRFAKFWKEHKGEKLSDEVQGIIGDRLQYYVMNHSDPTSFIVDFTDCFDWDDGQFGKSGSCWWGTYGDSLPTFEHGGGWAIRFYSDMDDSRGIGRTWIFPYGNVLLCFNSYGIERPLVSKVIKQVFYQNGVTLHYKKTEVYNSNNGTIPYINSGTGFVLYPEGMSESDLLDKYDLDLETYQDDEYTNCHECGRRIAYDESNCIGDNDYCERCTDKLFSYCERCEEYCDRDDVHPIKDSRWDYICQYCADAIDAVMCYSCDCYTESYVTTEDTNDNYCDDCRDGLFHCDNCNEWYADSDSCPDCDDTEEDDTEESESVLNEDIERDFITCDMERVTLAMGNTRNLTEVTTNVYRHELINGLFVNRDANNENYSITHEVSGIAIFHTENLFSALEGMERLGIVTDWNRSAESLSGDSTVMRQIMNIRNEVNH